MRAGELATRIEDVARGLAIKEHRDELEGVARELRELGPNAPTDPIGELDAAIAAAEDELKRRPPAPGQSDPRTAWLKAIAVGIRAMVAQGGGVHWIPGQLGEVELGGEEEGPRAPFPRTSPEAPAFPATLPNEREATVAELKALCRAALIPDFHGDPEDAKAASAELRKRAESPAREDREDAAAALSELAVEAGRSR